MAKQDPFEIPENKFSRGKLAGKFKLSWTEQSFDIEEQNDRRMALAHTRNYIGVSINEKRIKHFLLIIFVGLMIVLMRIFYLQVFKGNYYHALAENNRIRILPIPSERGIIYDRFGKELVQNVPSFTLSIVPQDLPRNPIEREKIIKRVAEMGDVSLDKIKEILQKYSAYGYVSLMIKENLDYKSVLQLYIQSADLPGVIIESSTKRHYLNSGPSTASSTLSLSHLLGYLSKLNDQELEKLKNNGYLPSDTIGKVGLEKSYEESLRGVYGRKKIEVNALGREQNILAVEPPIPGQNLILTIDLDAQNKLENIVKTTLERLGKKRAVALALNPQNGEILALVSYPVFDNNQFSGGISSTTYRNYITDPDRPLFNRAIGGTYPPGSTIKPIIAAAALEEKVIDKNTVFNSVGGFKVGQWFFKDWLAGGHGITNVTKALAWSVNTFFYYIGGGYGDFKGLGLERLLHYLAAFNVGKKTGVDLPGERSGFLPNKDWKIQQKGEPWFVGDTYNLSIGQGDLLVTPLQVAIWTAAIANGGKLREPYLVDKIINPVDKGTVSLRHKILNENFISPQNLTTVKQGMRECVLSGSCQLMLSLPFTVAGKTGTAQWSNNHPTHAWFTSFAPFDNPQIVVTVLVEEGGEGGSAAMPVARDFLDWWGKKYLTHK